MNLAEKTISKKLASKYCFDWYWVGQDMNGYNNPPAYVKEDILKFNDCLAEMVTEKTREANARLAEVLPESEEAKYIERWKKYWVKVWHAIFNVTKSNPSYIVTQEEIERAREADWLTLFPELKQRGNKKIGKCVFHSEKTGSFTVYEDGHYHCFGCEAHGDTIDFVMRQENLNFNEAVRSLL